jgi:ribosome maturation protein SDO1
MVNTIARIKRLGKNFEILVDMDDALRFKKGMSSFIEAQGDRVFRDSKKGDVPSSSELEAAFGTSDLNTIVSKIVKDGEILLTQEHRDEEKERRIKQVVDFLATHSIDPKTGYPHSTERIKNALEQSHINIKNTSVESQINDILSGISKIIPIKLETKKIEITIPAIYTGKVYGLVNQYKEHEKWLDDGSLEVIVSVPAGIIMDFYDKLNNATHGAATTEEIKQE